MLCLNKTLYRAFIRLQADKDLGRSYAGLLPWVEGMYHFGYLSEQEYQENVKRYSEPLTKKESDRESPEAKRERELLESKDSVFKGMIEQFSLHAGKPGWCAKVREDAEQFKDYLESARTVLSLIASVKNSEFTVARALH
jgi:hypothetical protein